MSDDKSTLITLIFWAAVAGNVVFILWISYNAINEGFSGTLPEKFSYVGLTGLLATNTTLLFWNRKMSRT